MHTLNIPTNMANTNLLRGDEEVSPEALEQMRNSTANHQGTRWAAYQNHDLGHPELGHLRFLAVGPFNTLTAAPERHPDTVNLIGWRYRLVGWVNLISGSIQMD